MNSIRSLVANGIVLKSPIIIGVLELLGNSPALVTDRVALAVMTNIHCIWLNAEVLDGAETRACCSLDIANAPLLTTSAPLLGPPVPQPPKYVVTVIVAF